MKTIILSVLYLVLLCWNIILQLSPTKSTLINFLFTLSYTSIYFYSGFLAFSSPKSVAQNSINIGLKFLGLGLIAWAMGGVIWSIYNLILNIEVPYPSIADFFFFLFIPLLVIGLTKILFVYRAGLNTKIFVQAIIIMVVGFFGNIFVISKPDLSQTLPVLTRFLNIAYPTADAIFLTISFILFKLSTGGKIQRAFLVLGIASIIQVLADFLFAHRTATGTYWNGDISDLFFMTSALVFGLGIIKLKEVIN